MSRSKILAHWGLPTSGPQSWVERRGRKAPYEYRLYLRGVLIGKATTTVWSEMVESLRLYGRDHHAAQLYSQVKGVEG